jgi:serine/threonine protein kinase
MSPEQVRGSGGIGVQTDIWALGVVMYELLAHRPAFLGNTPEALCVQTLSAPVASLAELRPDLPAELVRVVERCLERSPERRFADVAELAAALAAALPGGVATALPAPLTLHSAAIDPEHDTIEEPCVLEEPDLVEPPNLAEEQAWLEEPNTAAPFALIPRLPSPAQRRRVLARSLATAIFVPALAVLPCALAAPQFSSVRTWSLRASGIARENWLELRALWERSKGAPPASPTR